MVRENATVSIETVLAGRALAGDDGANLPGGAAGLKTVLREEGAERLDIGERDALHLDGQAGGHGDLAAAEFFSAASTIARISSG